MTEQASSQGSTSSRWHVQRPLSEPVLESVEEELGARGAQQEEHAPLSGNGIDRRGWLAWNQMREQLSQQVSQQPARTALLAVGAGALAALLLSRIFGSKRGQS